MQQTNQDIKYLCHELFDEFKERKPASLSIVERLGRYCYHYDELFRLKSQEPGEMLAS